MSSDSVVGDYEVQSSVNSRQSAIQTLYTAERSMGIALHNSTLYTTIANLTYLGVVLGLWFGRSTSSVSLPNGLAQTELVHLPPIALLVLPIPAWGLASYHVIQFAMVTAHGHSIAVLERELIKSAGLTSRRNEIGSRAEELKTNVTMKDFFMIIVSVLAYGVAFFGVMGFAVVCSLQIADAYGWFSCWTYGSILINAIATVCVALGFASASRQLNRQEIWKVEEMKEADAAHDSEPHP